MEDHQPLQAAAAPAPCWYQRPRLRRTGLCLALVVLTALIWCGTEHRFSRAAWHLPQDYSGDSLEVLARQQAAAEWNLLPGWHSRVDRLGAPYGAEWSEYPAPDDVWMLALGQLSRLTGMGVASNLALLAAAVFSALSFYLCARYLRCRVEWAAAGALLFAFSYFNLSRGLPHLSFTFSYTVPLAILSSWLAAASGRLAWRSREAGLCIAVAALLGVSNPYYLFLYLQLMGWAWLAQACTRRRPANLQIGAAAIILALGCFCLVNADVWVWSRNGAAPLLARNYHGTELYALKPIELFLPPPQHRLAAMAYFARRYLRWSQWRGEAFSPYLGVVGAIGLIALIGTLVFRLVRGRRKPPGAALQAGWILMFSGIGGINSILAFFFGLQIFRATNRFSIFLLALALCFVALRCSRWLRRAPRLASWALAGLVATGGLLDQIPRPNPARDAAMAADFAADEALARRVESRLPAGAMVFELPWLPFPEAGPRFRLSDYELFRPYLHARSLRFSYGYLAGRAPGQWYREWAALPPAEMVRRLEASGFAAIYVNRKGFADGGQALLAGLAAAGRADRLQGTGGNQVYVFLHPSAQPAAPLAARPTFGAGWNPSSPSSPGNPRWANGAAVLTYFNPFPHPIEARLHFAAEAVDDSPRHLTVRLRGQTLLRSALGPRPQPVADLVVELQPGVNDFDLASDEPPVRGPAPISRMRAFAIVNASLQPLPTGSAAGGSG